MSRLAQPVPLAPHPPLAAPGHRTVPTRPVSGTGGVGTDAIADFLAYLLRQHEAAAALFPGTRPPRENEPSPRP